MNAVDTYSKYWSEFGVRKILIGVGGIELCPPEELTEWQVGYATDIKGTSQVDDNGPGAWRSYWLVIAREIALGDPIFMDTSATDRAIMTAIHGISSWSPEVVATSLESFFQCLDELRTIAAGRSSPVELRNKPISLAERKNFLSRIKELNSREINVTFWDVMIGSEKPLN